MGKYIIVDLYGRENEVSKARYMVELWAWRILFASMGVIVFIMLGKEK